MIDMEQFENSRDGASNIRERTEDVMSRQTPEQVLKSIVDGITTSIGSRQRHCSL
jgi:hypothetical protein